MAEAHPGARSPFSVPDAFLAVMFPSIESIVFVPCVPMMPVLSTVLSQEGRRTADV